MRDVHQHAEKQCFYETITCSIPRLFSGRKSVTASKVWRGWTVVVLTVWYCLEHLQWKPTITVLPANSALLSTSSALTFVGNVLLFILSLALYRSFLLRMSRYHQFLESAIAEGVFLCSAALACGSMALCVAAFYLQINSALSHLIAFFSAAAIVLVSITRSKFPDMKRTE